MRMWVAALVLSISTPVSAQSLGSTSGASSSINIANPANITSTNRLITPPTVVAPGLAAAGIETCLGSNSGGVSLMGGGVTFGSTKVDDGCTIRLLSRQLFAFGFQKAAVALMCQDDRVAAAMAVTGTSCPERSAPREPGPRDRTSGVTWNPLFSFAENSQPPSAERPRSSLDEAKPRDVPAGHLLDLEVKPFTLDEQMLFARTSN
jgi:hypothetical protein